MKSDGVDDEDVWVKGFKIVSPIFFLSICNVRQPDNFTTLTENLTLTSTKVRSDMIHE